MSDGLIQGAASIFGAPMTPEFFEPVPERRAMLKTIHDEVLAYFDGQLPDLGYYIAAIRSELQSMDQDRPEFDPEKHTQAETHAWLGDRIADLRSTTGKNHPSDGRQLFAYTIEVYQALYHMGPLWGLLDDPDVTDIMVHSWDRISVQRRTTGERVDMTGLSFASEKEATNILQGVMSAGHKTVNESVPIADGIVRGVGARIVVLMSDVVPDGTASVLRKQSEEQFTPADLLAFRAFTPEVGDFMRLCVLGKLNMIVVGATGSGKTALISALLHHMPHDRHTVTIEDTPEIQMPEDYLTYTRLTTRIDPNKPDDPKNIPIYRLVKSALRMNPEYIIVGETRGQEAWEMLQAMQTGHSGITSIHADGGADALMRLEGMMSMAGSAADATYLRRNIAEVMHIFIIQGWVGNGKTRRRAIRSVFEVVPTVRAEDLSYDDLMPATSMLTAGEMLSRDPQYVRQHGEATLRELYHYDMATDRLVQGVLPSGRLMDRFAMAGLLDDYAKIRSM